MSGHTAQVIAAAGVLIVFGCLLALAILPDTEERQREEALKRKREEAKLRQQADAEEARKKLVARGKHIHQIPLSRYKPAAAYLAPAKPEPVRPTNVEPIRKAKR